MIGRCKLCGKKISLIKSHIIPEGFYTNIYDDKSRLNYSSESRKHLKYEQKGYRENLLCERCDGNILGNYDKYAIEVIRDRKHIVEENNDRHFLWSGLDFNKFKLFHLSILWRAHISNNRTKGIHLSQKKQHEVKKCLLKGEIPKNDHFSLWGFCLINPRHNNEVTDKIITFGNTYQFGNTRKIKVYVFIFGGFAWNYSFDKTCDMNLIKNIVFKDRKPLKLKKINIFDFGPFLDVQGSIDFLAKKISYRKAINLKKS